MAWLELEARVNDRTLFGQDGVRDPENPCGVFEAVPGIDWLGLYVTSPGDGDCDSDGHYLCAGCARLSRRGYENRVEDTIPDVQASE